MRVVADDGWHLDLEVREPTGRARGVLFLGHAMMANRTSLDRPRGAGLASALVAAGWRVALADLRGHGRSGPTPAEGGSYTYEDLVLRDVPAIVAALSERDRNLPLAIVGHSLTSHAALAWLGQADPAEAARVSAVVGIACNVWLPDLEPSAARRLAKRAFLESWRLMALPRGRFEARRLGLGSDDVAGPYIEDFVRWARTGRWETRDGRDLRAGLANVTVPVLSIAGAGDRFLCAPESARRFMAALERAPVTEWVVGRSTGLEVDPGHMALVTDSRSAPMWRDLATWLDTHRPPAAGATGPGLDRA